MAAKLNPELNVGDEVILLYMTDERTMRSGLSGIVQSINNTPWGPQYSVKWETGSTLDLIPGADKWALKSELLKKKISEEINPKTQNLIDNKTFLKYVKNQKKVFDFLKLLQKSGLTNMLGAGNMLTYTSDNMSDYIRGQFKDPDDYSELIDAAEDSRNALIGGVMNMYEDMDKSFDDMHQVNRDFQKMAKHAMDLYFKNYRHFTKNE
jgi:hypothetical protein